jgi:hypothetical protein
MDARNKGLTSSCPQLITYPISATCKQFYLQATVRGAFCDPRFRACVMLMRTCIIIIITRKSVIFSQSLLQDSTRLPHSIVKDIILFNSLDFVTVFFFVRIRVVRLATNPKSEGQGIYIYCMSPRTASVV